MHKTTSLLPSRSKNSENFQRQVAHDMQDHEEIQVRNSQGYFGPGVQTNDLNPQVFRKVVKNDSL